MAVGFFLFNNDLNASSFVFVGRQRRAGSTLNWFFKDVATSRNGFDDLLCVIAQGAAHLDQALHQGIIRDCRIRPNLLDQFRFAD